MTLTEVRQLISQLNLIPSKVLGQNFLIDQNIRDIILQQADIRPDETVLEIGPGLGALTEELFRLAGRLLAIEKDRRLAAHLRQRFPDLELIVDDAVKRLRSPAYPWPESFTVVANLPYSISSPILECLVEAPSRPRKMVFTVQREVAERLAATPRHKEYGALTVYTALRYHTTIVHVVSPRCFYPRPHVDSAVIVLERRDPRTPLRPGAPFHDIVRVGFSQRRKMLRKLLGAYDGVEEAFRVAEVAPTARAEELGLEQWITLANAIGPETAPALVKPGRLR